MPKSNFVPNTFSINTKALMNKLRTYYVKALKDAEDQLIEIMKDQVMVTVYGDGPGKPEWRSQVQRDIKTVYREIADSYIESGVGLPYNESSWQYIRAMLINLGSGSRSENPDWPAREIWTKPGRQVWDDDLRNIKTSAAETTYPLPDMFNQEGNHFIENAMKIMAKKFDDVLDQASMNLPDDFFYRSVVSKKGA